jgi:outer membrane protein TolC
VTTFFVSLQPKRAVPPRILGLILVGVMLTSGASGQTEQTRFVAGMAATAPESLSLRECVQMAMRQNADVVLARLEQQEAQTRVQRVGDPLSLKLGVGSGLAYTSGFPMNVGGSGPSIINAQASLTLYDRPLRYRVAEAKERAKGSALSEQEKQSAVALEVARLYLDAEALMLAKRSLQAEIDALERVLAIRRSQQEEGRVLPLEEKRAQVQLAGARYRLRETESSLSGAQARLGFLLGKDGEVKVSGAGERARPPLPGSEDAAAREAVGASMAAKRLRVELAANQFRNKAAQSTRWPVIRLVSQYSMFSRFNNYDDFYNRFERHNGQVGASFELPLFSGGAAKAEKAEADVEGERLRLNLQTAERKAAVEAAEALRTARDAEAYQELMGMELEVARENVSVLLARVNAGRARLEELEQARSEENRKWVEYYRSRARAEEAAYDLLHKTGGLVAWFQ